MTRAARLASPPASWSTLPAQARGVTWPDATTTLSADR